MLSCFLHSNKIITKWYSYFSGTVMLYALLLKRHCVAIDIREDQTRFVKTSCGILQKIFRIITKVSHIHVFQRLSFNHIHSLILMILYEKDIKNIVSCLSLSITRAISVYAWATGNQVSFKDII